MIEIVKMLKEKQQNTDRREEEQSRKEARKGKGQGRSIENEWSQAVMLCRAG